MYFSFALMQKSQGRRTMRATVVTMDFKSAVFAADEQHDVASRFQCCIETWLRRLASECNIMLPAWFPRHHFRSVKRNASKKRKKERLFERSEL